MVNSAIASEPETLTAALSYARKGLPVAPAHSVVDGKCSCNDASCGKQAGKHPRTAHGLTDATVDEKKIREWWGKWPDANVLIRTGKVGDRYLVVMDVDPRHGGRESFDALRASNEIPDTWTVNTGGDGAHFFMWSKHPVKNSANVVAPGIDVRGVGGYVIAAPSTHASGKRYSWAKGASPDDMVLAEAPAWLVARAGLAGTRVKIDPKDIQGADISELCEGGRNMALASIAGHLRRPGLGERSILAALRVLNEDRCKPPLDDWEVERIARSIASNPAGAPVHVDGSDPMPMLTWKDVAAPLPPVPWLVEGLGIAPGAVTIVGGAGGGGKTWAMMAMMVAIGAKRPVWGQFAARHGRCIHVDFEQGPYLTKMRYQKIAVGLGIKLEELDPSSFGLCTMPRAFPTCDKSTEDILVRACEGAVMAIVDAFRGAFPRAKENDSEAREYLDMLHRVSDRTGCTMIVIAHSRKASDDNDIRSALRGSSALFDAAQTVYMLDGSPGKPTRVTNTKDRWTGIDRPAFGLRRQDVWDATGQIPGIEIEYMSPAEVTEAYSTDQNDMRMSAERLRTACARVIAFLETYSHGAIEAQIRAAMGITTTDFRAVIAEMYQSGRIRTEGKGTQMMYCLVDRARSREPGED